ncbi:MAG: metallophosphoesterase family protein [Desulfobacterales bacterium]|nr:MAG: metallophosphoesterase family protein [Desulfobacterales bacterium]
MNAIIVSDLHIGSRYFQSGMFERFLEELPADHGLIMNGDIIDAPHGQMAKSDQSVLDRIEKISHQRQMVWIRGNHENGYVPQNFGQVVFKRQYSIGNRLLITHGDDFDDIMPRSRLFIKAFKLMHNLRVKLGGKPMHVAEYAKKWKSFYRVLRNHVALNAVKCAAENGYRAVTCGHTHYPEEVAFNGIRYINTGAWTEFPAYYLHITPDAMTLKQVDPSFVMQRAQSAHSDQMDSALPSRKASHCPANAGPDLSKIAPGEPR